MIRYASVWEDADILCEALALVGVWILFGGTQIGGAISHH